MWRYPTAWVVVLLVLYLIANEIDDWWYKRKHKGEK